MESKLIDKKGLFSDLKNKVDDILLKSRNKEKTLKSICKLLNYWVEYYHWVGFYLVEDGSEVLHLGPFVGAPTEHVRIPFGKGICGQAAVVGETVVIQDVSKVTNYLSCAPDVRSEIVVPIFNGEGRIIGELDIDSHDLAPFSYHDREFLEYICKRLPSCVDMD